MPETSSVTRAEKSYFKRLPNADEVASDFKYFYDVIEEARHHIFEVKNSDIWETFWTKINEVLIFLMPD
jgi:hypothetical protein